MEAKLVVVGGKANMGEVKLRLPMTIGRGNKADLIISHPTVSRIHCKLSEVDGLLVIRDNSSSNGTFVDNQQITESVVRPGQQLKIGPITFRAEYEIAEILPAPASNESGPAMAETQSIDRDSFDFLADNMFDDVVEKKEKTAPAAKLPEKAKPKPEVKPKEKAPEAKKTPAPAPAKPAKQEPPKFADETAVFESAAEMEFEETTSDKDGGKSMFDEIEDAPSNSGTAATVEMPAESASSPAMDFDFLSELNVDEPAQEPPAVPLPPEALAVAPVVEELEPTVEPELPTPQASAPAAPPEKVSAEDFDFLSELEPEAAAPEAETAPPQAKSAEPKFFEPKPTEPAVSFDFTGDLGITETKPFEMPHIPAAEDAAPQEPPAIETPDAAPPEKVSAADFDFLADLEPEPVAESPVVEPPAAPVEPEAAEAWEPVAPEAIVPSAPADEPIVTKTVSTEELDLVFDFDEAVAPSEPVAPQPVAEQPEVPAFEEPIAEEPAFPVAEEPQWPGVMETPVAEIPVTETPATSSEPVFDFEEELAASAPLEPVPFTPYAEAPAAEPAAEWSSPAEPAAAASPEAEAFDFLDFNEPAAATPAVEPEAPQPTEPAVAFDLTGESGLAETQQFVMPKETPDENPQFSFAPAAEAAPSAEPEASGFAPEAESPFAAPPVAKRSAAPQPAAAKLSFVDKIKMLLGLGGKKAPVAKKGSKPSGLEATAAAAAAPIAVPKFGSHSHDTSSIPLADDAPIPLFGDEPAAAAPVVEPFAPSVDELFAEAPPVDIAPPVNVAPQIDVAPPEGEANSLFDELAMMDAAATPVVEPPAVEVSTPPEEVPVAAAPPVDVAPQIDVAPPEGEAHSLFDELEMMSGAPSAEPEHKFYEPTPAVGGPVSFNFTGDIGIHDSKPFEMPHSAVSEGSAAEEPAAEVPVAPPVTETQPEADILDELFGFNEPPAPASTPVAETPAPAAEQAPAAAEEDLFAAFAESEAAPSEPVAESPAAETSPIVEAAAEAKAELEDLFASFTGAEPPASIAPESSEPAMTEPLAESPAVEPAARDESAFNELFAPGDAPESAPVEPAAASPLDVTTNFTAETLTVESFAAESFATAPEPASPFAWDEPAPGEAPETPLAASPISAELAAPMPSIAEELAAAVAPVAVGATRPYVIDVDVRHTYLNRLAVRIAAKMSQLDIAELEPEMPAGRSFNRIGKPPAPAPVAEPAIEDAPRAVAGEAVFVASDFVAEPPPAFDNWGETPVEADAFGSAAPLSMPVEPEFDASSLFGEEPQADAAPPASGTEGEGLTAMFNALPEEASPMAEWAPAGNSAAPEAGVSPEEDSPFADWAPSDEAAAPEATAPAKEEEPKRPAPPSAQAPQAPAKPASKDDDLDSFLNDLGMG